MSCGSQVARSMDFIESRKRSILVPVIVLFIQMVLLAMLVVFEPLDDGIWFLYFVFLITVILASFIFVFKGILNGTFKQGSSADLVVGVIAILLFYTIPAGISLLWLHHSLNPQGSTSTENMNSKDAKISVFTEPGEDRISIMGRLKKLNFFIGLILAFEIALLLFYVLIYFSSFSNTNSQIYGKIPIYFLPAFALALSVLHSYAISRKIIATAKLLPGEEGIIVRLKKERYLFGYYVSSRVKIGRRKYLAGSNIELMPNESVVVEMSVYVKTSSRVWLLLNVKPASG